MKTQTFSKDMDGCMLPDEQGEWCRAEHVAALEKELEAALEDSSFLECLIAAGVDSWEGYDFAREMLAEDAS
jgi:hypothetical protein